MGIRHHQNIPCSFRKALEPTASSLLRYESSTAVIDQRQSFRKGGVWWTPGLYHYHYRQTEWFHYPHFPHQLSVSPDTPPSSMFWEESWRPAQTNCKCSYWRQIPTDVCTTFFRQDLILKSSFFVHWHPWRSLTLSYKLKIMKIISYNSWLGFMIFLNPLMKRLFERGGNSITRRCIPRPRRWRGPFVILSIVILSSH